jgi:arginyl-tRNA synthetase
MLLQQIAELARQALSQSLQIRAQRIPVEFPADRTHGDLTINAFLIAREIRGSPNLIAEELARSLSGLGPIESAAAVRGYVNLRLATEGSDFSHVARFVGLDISNILLEHIFFVR